MDGASLEKALARLQELLLRLEHDRGLELPGPPPDVVRTPAPAEAADPELEKLRAEQVCEREALRRAGVELETLRADLQSAQLARAELEARLVTELAEVSDIAQAKIQHLEEELRGKKRGLSALNEQNVHLQGLVENLEQELERLRATETRGAGKVFVRAGGTRSASLLNWLMQHEEGRGAP